VNHVPAATSSVARLRNRECDERNGRENQFGELVEQNRGTNLNAFTDSEETGYFYSLPSNQIELWAYLESERFLHPVLREFYKEREVVHEERRLGESDPFGRLFEQFVAAAL
jgi:predicted Zn-dependent peptidase